MNIIKADAFANAAGVVLDALDDPGAQLGQVRLVLGVQWPELGGEAGICGHYIAVYPDQVLLGGDGVE